MDTIQQAIKGIEELEQRTPTGSHIITGDIRKLSASLYRGINDKSITNVFAVCEKLLEQQSWALGVIAFDFAFRMKKQYNSDAYATFYRWLKTYVHGWGDCDDFCTHAFGELLRQQKSLFRNIEEWTNDKGFWVRRASAVILIPSILHNELIGIDPISIADRLLLDEHDLVCKGYGWMLKCLSLVEPSRVEEYLTVNHDRMPRVAYRYALEKLDNETKRRLMAL